jgi:hypothetical protein
MIVDRDITDDMIKCKIADDGLTVQVNITKPATTTLLDPSFLLDQYEGLDEWHPVFSSLQSAQRAFSDGKESFEVVVNVKLLFPCDPSGLYDPVRESSSTVHGIQLRTYALDKDKHLGGKAIVDEPTINLLTFACLEWKAETLRQPIQTASFLKRRTSDPTGGVTGGGNVITE